MEQVLVVGGGLAGLSAAMFLGVHNVPAVLVERHPTTSIYPKARGQYPHTMEALRVAGVDDLMHQAAPPDPGFRIVVGDSVTGQVFNEILVDTSPDLSHLSPAGWANASQEAAEPVLAARAQELGADLRFGTELLSFTQSEHAVTATLKKDNETYELQAQYLIAADGHRSPIRHALDIGTHGRGELGRSSGIVFDADLPHKGFALYYLQNPALPGGAGVVVSTDTPNRWALSVGHDPTLTPETWLPLIRTATGVPTLTPTLVTGGTETGHTAARVADQFSKGRTHLIGDAARVMPPTGGFGGNTAILDAYYLAWKLAWVLQGAASPSLLTTHDPERRPYADLIVEQQYTEFITRMRPDLADDTLAPPADPVSSLFFGYRHLSNAITKDPNDDNAALENPETPTARPGSRAPHVPLTRAGHPISTIDLFGRSFVLLTGPAAPHRAPALIETHQIGKDVEDPHSRWPQTYNVTPEGAVLVRPDGFITWRSPGPWTPEEVTQALHTATHPTA